MMAVVQKLALLPWRFASGPVRRGDGPAPSLDGMLVPLARESSSVLGEVAR
ncbi:hypothetical protein [Myxococcus fulvus]|uniref:hypothetical protein n=1 Tax=Myxococcus fulvus TaxID=33 RepID=UPI0020BF0312|nr:hypothetical protein [Myxococcus fulvus]MCK8501233.1 hypothetical protein [Myxococcus fulvus]